MLEETGLEWIPVFRSWRLNERHYGALQGLNKAETAAKHGEDQVKIWRRAYAIPPPALDEEDPRHPSHDPRYKGASGRHCVVIVCDFMRSTAHVRERAVIWWREEDWRHSSFDATSASSPLLRCRPSRMPRADVAPADLPRTESLASTVERFLPAWTSDIAPKIAEGKKVLIVAHGNSLRALVKYLNNIGDDEIVELNIPTGVPLVYELDSDLKPIRHYYLGDAEAVAARAAAVAAQAKAGPAAAAEGGGAGGK